MKKALVTGVTGQDGSYLVELLLDKGYEVHGVRRRVSAPNNERLGTALKDGNFIVHEGDMTETSSLATIISSVAPDEVYNLAAQSHVHVSFDTPEYTSNTNALGALRILDAIRSLGRAESTRFYQAGTSEMFGKVQRVPQDEDTPFYPRSPYGVAKVYAYWITKNYREAYGMFAANGILFNHESPRRGDNFVTQKVVKALRDYSRGSGQPLTLGNMDSLRDWGHAKDFVEAMWLMLQHDRPDDYVVATGEQHSVREFVEACAPHFGLQIEWRGEGVDEVGIDARTGEVAVRVSREFFRPAEVDSLVGDSSKARRQLGWHPRHTFEMLVEDMCLSAQRETGENR